MKTTIFIGLFTTFSLLCCPGQTPDNLVLQGRAFLAARNITNANARFAQAVKLAPAHQTANALYSVTRLLSLPYTQPWQDMMDRMGVALTNRDLYAWSAAPQTDSEGVPVPPNQVGVEDLVAFVSTNLLPELHAAAANLAQITDPNFVLSLASNETTVGEATIDYGDIRLIHAGLSAAKCGIYTLSAHNVSAQLNALYTLYKRGELTAEKVLSTYTNALALENSDSMTAAAGAMREAVTQYLVASEVIRARPTNMIRLFNFDPEMQSDESSFRQTITELRDSLNGPVTLTSISNGVNRVTVDLTKVFAEPAPVRPLLPSFKGNTVLVGTLEDSTFGGAVFGLSDSDIYEALSSGVDLMTQFGPATRLPDGTLEMQLKAVNEAQYVIEVSSDLESWSEWMILQCTNGLVCFQATAGTNRVFYRARNL